MDQLSHPIIYVVSVCFNEAKMLPFFLDYYINFFGATRVILYDGGSNDGSDLIAAQYPQVDFKVDPSKETDDRDLMRFRNEEWKKFRAECDWMIVCDVDEFLYCPNPIEELRKLKKNGITLPMVEGYAMYGKSFPRHEPGKYLWQEFHTGIAEPVYGNKNMIFDPRIDINYGIGCHRCDPTGPVVRSDQFVFKGLHYSMLSYDFVVEKSRMASERYSDWNKQVGAGFHRKQLATISQLEFNQKFFTLGNVFQPIKPPTSISQAMHSIARLLLEANKDQHILELGSEQHFGDPVDGGSTEFYAWFVHNYSGRFLSVDSDPQVSKNARFKLRTLHGDSPRTRLMTSSYNDICTIDDHPWDVIHLSGRLHNGEKIDPIERASKTLHDFRQVEPQLADLGLVVVDGRDEEDVLQGHAQGVVSHLLGRGFKPHMAGRYIVFARHDITGAR